MCILICELVLSPLQSWAFNYLCSFCFPNNVPKLYLQIVTLVGVKYHTILPPLIRALVALLDLQSADYDRTQLLPMEHCRAFSYISERESATF